MPVTLPAHAAAILPFCSKRLRFLPPVALVVGSAAPDLDYLLGVYGTASHTLPGLFTQAIPKGVLAYLWAELLLLPMLRERLPSLGRVQLARFAATRGVPRSVRGWLGVLAALVLGGLTHLLWDSLTHVGWWPERLLFGGARLHLGNLSIAYARILWVLSSVFGSLGVLWYLARLYPRLPSPGSPVLRSTTVLWVALATGALFGLVWRSLFPSGYVTGWQVLWSYFWALARYSAVAVSVLGLHDAWRRWRPQPGPPMQSGGQKK